MIILRYHLQKCLQNLERLVRINGGSVDRMCAGGGKTVCGHSGEQQPYRRRNVSPNICLMQQSNNKLLKRVAVSSIVQFITNLTFAIRFIFKLVLYIPAYLKSNERIYRSCICSMPKRLTDVTLQTFGLLQWCRHVMKYYV